MSGLEEHGRPSGTRLRSTIGRARGLSSDEIDGSSVSPSSDGDRTGVNPVVIARLRQYTEDWAPAAPPFSWPIPEDEDKHEFHHPLDRVTGRLPRRVRIVVDWVVTIVGAVAIVLAIKAWVVNPYRIPSSSMESTLHCARPAAGCESRFSDRVLANRFIYRFTDPGRGDVVVFETPPQARAKCGAGGTFVKRIIGLPGETVQIRLRRGSAYVYIDGRPLKEPYIEPDRRDIGPEERFRVPQGGYFVMGDNRSQSCDSRVWGSVPKENLIGPVFMTYWPPNRISFF